MLWPSCRQGRQSLHCSGSVGGSPQGGHSVLLQKEKKKSQITSNETRRKSGVFASDHERPSRCSLAPITLWKMPDQTVCADFSEPESQRGPRRSKASVGSLLRIERRRRKKIMCAAIKKFLFFKVLSDFYHPGKWLSRFLIGFFLFFSFFSL